MDLDVAPPGRPSDAQRAAVAAADRRARQCLALPAYSLRWVHAPDAQALASTRYAPLRVFIRDDLPPHQCYHTTLHELQHVADDEIITDISHAEAERRAEAFAARVVAHHEHEDLSKEDIMDYLKTPMGYAPGGTPIFAYVVPARSIAPAPTLAPSKPTPTGRPRVHNWREGGWCGGQLVPISPSSSRCLRCGAAEFESVSNN